MRLNGKKTLSTSLIRLSAPISVFCVTDLFRMEKLLLYLENVQICWKVIDARIWVWDEFEWQKARSTSSLTLSAPKKCSGEKLYFNGWTSLTGRHPYLLGQKDRPAQNWDRPAWNQDRPAWNRDFVLWTENKYQTNEGLIFELWPSTYLGRSFIPRLWYIQAKPTQ